MDLRNRLQELAFQVIKQLLKYAKLQYDYDKNGDYTSLI